MSRFNHKQAIKPLDLNRQVVSKVIHDKKK